MGGDWHLGLPVLEGHGGWTILALSVLYFPKLALGLTGFETGVSVMPHIAGGPQNSPDNHEGRIRNTRKLLTTAALIMSVYLLGSRFVTATLIPPQAFERQGPAADRALAYLAHGRVAGISPLFGDAFGTLYDLSTVAILAFAAISAMAGLLNLAPQYLPRYGMAPEWARAIRPLVVVFTAINLFVTVIFAADDAQGGAYATGVLVLITSACVATVIDLYRQRRTGRLVVVCRGGSWPSRASSFTRPGPTWSSGPTASRSPAVSWRRSWSGRSARASSAAPSCVSNRSSSPAPSRNSSGTA